jgi:citronellol/citronellal dehydrogenase
VDIRDEKSVADAITKAVEHFGGLDIVINNASALFNTGVEEMPVKKYDLVMGINARGTFITSKYAIPHLRKSKNPHILSISPPLYMGTDSRINWFAKIGTGYVLAKYGMTLLTHGLAGELKDDGIACNTLWPKTTIATAAVENLLGGGEAMAKARKPEIMGDAAYEILTSDSKTTTDNFFIDDEVLLSKGMNLTEVHQKYTCDPSQPMHMLIPDYMM